MAGLAAVGMPWGASASEPQLEKSRAGATQGRPDANNAANRAIKQYTGLALKNFATTGRRLNPAEHDAAVAAVLNLVPPVLGSLRAHLGSLLDTKSGQVPPLVNPDRILAQPVTVRSLGSRLAGGSEEIVVERGTKEAVLIALRTLFPKTADAQGLPLAGPMEFPTDYDPIRGGIGGSNSFDKLIAERAEALATDAVKIYYH
ncbi:MAG: hypothetical protein IPG96_07095 [Proteobacteria bacterium]|nr:hypothetical protein [Pseudomonadota bacterium]